MVNTKKVKGRREVRYESFDDLLIDARRFAKTQVCCLGNWSPGQIFEHLARSLDGSIDGIDFAMPAPVRWIMSLLMKKKFLEGELPAGFKSSDSMIPGDTSVKDGLASLEMAITRQNQEPNRVMHPGFGNISRESWGKFHLRHAELHMSFLVPES